VCQVANINSPKQIVLSGTRSVLESATSIAKADFRCRGAKSLQVSAPFHSVVMDAARAPLSGTFREVLGQSGPVHHAAVTLGLSHVASSLANLTMSFSRRRRASCTGPSRRSSATTSYTFTRAANPPVLLEE